MALGDIMGGLASAYKGYQQGVRQTKADEMQDQVDALETKKMAAAADLLPDQTATAKLAQRNAQAKLQAESDLLPGATDIAKQEQERALRGQVDKDVAQAVQSASTAQQAQESIGGMMGKAIETNDGASLTRIIDHAVAIPQVFPGLNGFGRVKAAQVIDAPQGAMAADGQPIQGRAIQATFADGTTRLLRTDGPLAAWQRQKAAIEAQGGKVLGEGQTWVGQSGSILGRGAPKTNTALETEQFKRDNGATSYGGNGTPGSAGTVGKGKVPPTNEAAAQSMLDDTFEKNGKDLPPSARATAKAYLSQIARTNPSLDAATMHRVAFEAATDPAATAPALDPVTGQISKAYRNPEVNGGKPIVIAAGGSTPEAMEKALGGKDGMKKGVQQMLGAQDPVAQQLIIDYASGNKEAVEQKLAGLPQAQRDAALANIQRKAALVSQYGVKPAAPPAPAAAAPAARQPARGLSDAMAGGYTPPADSVAGRALAARQKSAAAGLAERNAKKQAQDEALRTASSQFQNEVSAATTPEARLAVVRKWDAQRNALPQSDLITLNQLASKI